MSSSYLDLALLVLLKHLVCVAVVCGDEHCNSALVANCLQSCKTQVNGLNADDSSVHAAGVTYHVAVRVVAANEVVLAGPDSLDELVGDLSGLHPGSLVEAYVVGRDLAVGLELLAYLAAAVAVPEVCYVAVLLGLGDSVLVVASRYQHLGHGVGDLGRVNQEACRKLQVAVVLQHACVAYVGLRTSVEVVELYHVERHGKLNSAVAAEVEQDNAVAVNDLAYRGDNCGSSTESAFCKIFDFIQIYLTFFNLESQIMFCNVDQRTTCDGRKDAVRLRCYNLAVFSNEDEVCSACLLNIGSCSSAELHILSKALVVSINDCM